MLSEVLIQMTRSTCILRFNQLRTLGPQILKSVFVHFPHLFTKLEIARN
jgi:hypothetical protein